MRIQRSGRGGRHSAIKSRLLCGSALASFAIISLATGNSAFGQDASAPNSPGNSITPDGRTATSMSVQGRVTDITTGTVAGGNAYNSFSTFGAAEGNTVNLHVPTGAGYLVNIVRNAPVDIQGTVNSYQNGTIGGNIVFADPYGLVVGKTGTINTGGLTIVTPTSATIENVLNHAGQINQGLAGQMIEGNVPLSPDGSVVIAGRVNAESYVRITAHDISVAGSEKEARKTARQKAQFNATVNSSGMAEGGSIVVRNGSIKLVAAGDVNIGGKVRAKGASGAVSIRAQGSVHVEKTARIKAGSKANQVAVATQATPAISIEAGKDARIDGRLAVRAAQSAVAGEIAVRAANTVIGSTASFVAQGSGTANGGTISIKSSIDTTVASGAIFTANALDRGNGGFVEISAVRTDTIAAGVQFDLTSKSGASGTILFDPTDLVIGGTSGSASMYSNGANVTLGATNSITIAGVIDTRAYGGNHVTGLLSESNVVSTGNSGSVTLTAPSITVNGGAAIYADVNN
jgi:filamentous hemagglutinin family protein